jgi:hypothetical protein
MKRRRKIGFDVDGEDRPQMETVKAFERHGWERACRGGRAPA